MRPRPLVLTAALAAALAPQAHAAAPPVAVTDVRPVKNNYVLVEPIAPVDGSSPPRWLMNLNVRLRNDGGDEVMLERVRITYFGGNVPAPTDVTGDLLAQSQDDEDLKLAPGESQTFIVPEGRFNDDPLPTQVRVDFFFAGYGSPIDVQRNLARYRNQVEYRFPLELSREQRAVVNAHHDLLSHHRPSDSQWFGYDIGVRRWKRDHWSSYVDEPGDKNEDKVAWGVPVVAMASGQVMRCWRTKPDNEPGEKVDGGGNSIWIRHANGEFAFYGHMQDGTVPKDVCPVEGDQGGNGVTVAAGRQLGLVGNSGHSGGPHLHVHLQTHYPPLDDPNLGSGRPLLFHGVRVRTGENGDDWTGPAPCDPSAPPFAVLAGASPAPYQLIEELPWPGRPEIARHAIAGECWQDELTAIAASGYEPEWIDAFAVDGKPYFNGLFRPAGRAWVARHDLTSEEYVEELAHWEGLGYRPRLVESYGDDDEHRYAAVFVRQSGPAYFAYHAKTEAEHEELAGFLVAAGYRPRNVSVVSAGGMTRWTALFVAESIGSFELKSSLTGPEYQEWLLKHEAAGRRLVYLNAWDDDGEPRFAAIVSSQASSKDAARHGLSQGEYQSEYEQLTALGYLTRVVTGYDDGGEARFAGLWRK
jgi:murein DD-endopeptidase MepM/ murein hydrolase activator NlpD